MVSLGGRATRNVLSGSGPCDSLSRVTLSDDDGLDLHHRFTYPVNTTSGTTDTAFIGPESSDSATVVITVDAHGLETSRALDIDPASPYQPEAEIIRTIDPDAGRDDARRVTAAYLDTNADETPDFVQAAYDYDQAGHLVSQGGVGFVNGSANGATYEYDVSETETTWASGLKIEEHLNLTLVGSAGAISATYTYDEDSENRLESATMDIDGDDTDDITDTYDFDQAGNLQSVIGAGGTWSYLYGYEADPASDSNRLVRIDKDGAPQMHFTFDPEDRWRTMQAPTSAQDDPDRELFTYTEAGRLATYQRYEGGTLALTATYTYDPAGQRKRSVVTEGTGEDEVITTTEYTYVGLSLQELRATQDGAQTASWRVTYLHDESGRPYAGIYRDNATQDPQFFLLVTTDRGDVVSLTDKNGNPFAAYRYDPWGDPVGEVSPPPLVRHEEDDTALTYQGTWTVTPDVEASEGNLTTTDETEASVTYEFTGTSIDWIASTSAIQAIASVTLDGGTPELIDLYSESTLHQESVWTSGTLEAGPHTLLITWTGTKNENSTGTTIGVDAFDVTGVPDAGHPATGVWVQGTLDSQSQTVIRGELAETISRRQVLRYAGYCYDSESGLYYLSARHYDPETRLFLSKDPSRNDGEQSAYQYSLGNPIAFVDPTGYDPADLEKYCEEARAKRAYELQLAAEYQEWIAPLAASGAVDNGIYFTQVKHGMQYLVPLDEYLADNFSADEDLALDIRRVLEVIIRDGTLGHMNPNYAKEARLAVLSGGMPDPALFVLVYWGEATECLENPLEYYLLQPNHRSPGAEREYQCKRNEETGRAYLDMPLTNTAQLNRAGAWLAWGIDTLVVMGGVWVEENLGYHGGADFFMDRAIEDWGEATRDRGGGMSFYIPTRALGGP